MLEIQHKKKEGIRHSMMLHMKTCLNNHEVAFILRF